MPNGSGDRGNKNNVKNIIQQDEPKRIEEKQDVFLADIILKYIN